MSRLMQAMQLDFLSDQEFSLFNELFPDDNPSRYTAQQARQMISNYATAGLPPAVMEQSRLDNSLGIQNLAPQLMPQSFPSSGQQASAGASSSGCAPCGGSSPTGAQQGYTQFHALTYVPVNLRMRHKSLGGGKHLAMLGNTIVLTFDYKRTCAGFCRSWNSLVSHLGACQPFLPSDLLSTLTNIILAGSGASGAQLGFSPPLQGRV
jgi:hypothetical protein